MMAEIKCPLSQPNSTMVQKKVLSTLLQLDFQSIVMVTLKGI